MDSLKDQEPEKDYKILIVDDEHEVLRALTMSLERSKEFTSRIATASNGEEGLAELENDEYDLVLSDFRMPKMDGIEFLNKVREKYPDIIRILITGYSEINIAKNAITKAKVHNYIEKPWDRDELVSIVNNELKNRSDKVKVKNKGSQNEPIELENVKDAMKKVKETQENMLKSTCISFDKEILIFEFNSAAEFNQFSHEIKKLKNVSVADIKIFENKYLVTLGILMDSYEKIM